MELIKNIRIDSYRGIEDLQLENLAQINILTGDNNCGKTSVLEVLNSFSQPDDISMWDQLTRKDTERAFLERLTSYELFLDLFNVNFDEKIISYNLEFENESWALEAVAKETMEQVTELFYTNLSGFYIREEEEREALSQQLRDVTKLQFKVWLNKKKIAETSIYEGQRLLLRNNPRGRRKALSKNIIYISPVRHATGTVFLSEILDHPELYEEMLGVLKEFDPGIISINYDNGGNSRLSGGFYKILSKENNSALPLNMYGDGMKKAILLMSAVVKAKDGILLLDEFESAIHTSAMDKVFKWILETCKKLNVQVFMTSHSKEAIDKVLKCSESLKKEIVLYTLYKDRDGFSVRRLDAETAIMAKDEMRLELR